MEELLKRELDCGSVKATGHSGGGCISQGRSYDTDRGRVFVKVNPKAEVRAAAGGEVGGGLWSRVRVRVRRREPVRVRGRGRPSPGLRAAEALGDPSSCQAGLAFWGVRGSALRSLEPQGGRRGSRPVRRVPHRRVDAVGGFHAAQVAAVLRKFIVWRVLNKDR